jgi:subtilisin family serine protease
MRGTITAAAGAICVGAIGSSLADSKFDASNCGPRVDVYAPGRFIMSSVNSTLGVFANDSRNTSFYVTKRSGTSMASPQVAGVIACLAETWPRLSQSLALTYIQTYAKTNQISAGTGGVTDYTDLQGSANRFLYFYKERPAEGQVSPKINQGLRPSTGLAWPRPKIYRYGGVPSVSPTAILLESGESLQTEDGFDLELE